MTNRLALLLCFFTFSLSSFSVAPEGATEDSALPVSKPIMLELYSWTYSPPFSDLSSRSVQVTNQLTVRTPLVGPFDFEVTPQFVLQPFEGQRFQLLDPSAGIEGTLLESAYFKYWARYEVLLPVTSASREVGMLVAPQAVQSIETPIAGTRLKVEAWLIPTLFLGGTPKLAFYLSPRLNYALSDAVSLIALAEVTWETTRGRDLFHLTKAADWNLGLGFKYAFGSGSGFWIHPFWNFSPEKTIASSSHLAVFFGGPLL